MHFSDLPERLAEVRGRIAHAAQRGGHGQEAALTIIAVTKTHGPEAVRAAVSAGIRDIGENKVQEALRKQDELESAGGLDGVRWHLIGHLQTNKAKALRRFALFHALDRDGLLQAVDAVATRTISAGSSAADEADAPMVAKPIDALVQVNVLGEESKGGYAPDALPALADRLHEARGITVRGVMTMAPFEAEEAALRAVFAGARAARDVLRAAGHPAVELSMGMSGDYEVAVEEGATMVRIGTVLFGERS